MSKRERLMTIGRDPVPSVFPIIYLKWTRYEVLTDYILRIGRTLENPAFIMPRLELVADTMPRFRLKSDKYYTDGTGGTHWPERWLVTPGHFHLPNEAQP